MDSLPCVEALRLAIHDESQFPQNCPAATQVKRTQMPLSATPVSSVAHVSPTDTTIVEALALLLGRDRLIRSL
jgi:hypothetical protein